MRNELVFSAAFELGAAAFGLGPVPRRRRVPAHSGAHAGEATRLDFPPMNAANSHARRLVFAVTNGIPAGSRGPRSRSAHSSAHRLPKEGAH